MCGRFVLILEPGDFEDEFDFGGLPESYLPRYNIAPTQPVAIVRDAETRKVEMFRWGLIPSWAKDVSIGSRMINARAETLAEKPSFKIALAKRRNLILASGFYEWRPADPMNNSNSKDKVPLFVHMKDNKPIVFAGLWEEWRSQDGEVIHSTTIITTNSNALIAPFHDRMPAILDGEKMQLWLDPTRKQEEIISLLQPYPAEAMEYHHVSRLVNNPANDNPNCIKEIVLD